MVKIVCDTSADLNFPHDNTLYEKYAITYIPMHVIFDEDDFRENISIKNSQFYELIRLSQRHPKTAPPSVNEILSVYKNLGKENEEILSLHISSHLSNSYRNSLEAKRIYEKTVSNPSKIYIIDSLAASTAFGVIVLKALNLKNQGFTGKEIFSALEEWKKTSVVSNFTVSDLNWLFEGGRLSRTKYAFGNLLNKKPILSLNNGQLVVLESVSGLDRALNFMANNIFAKFDPNSDHSLSVWIVESQIRKKAEKLQKKIEKQYEHVKIGFIFEMGCTIATHTGPGTIGLVATQDLNPKEFL